MQSKAILDPTTEKLGNKNLVEIIRKIIPFLGLIIMVLVFQIASEGAYITVGNLKGIINQVVYLAIISFGAIFVYSHGGMDISYGALLGFSVMTSILVSNTGAPFIVVILTSIVSSLLWSVINGVASIYLKVPSFITSLCIMYICRGILNTVCASQKYSIPVEMYKYDSWTFKIVTLVIIFVVYYLLFEKSSIGKNNKAIGGNIIATEQAGVNTNSARMIAYVISGIAVGISAIILMLRAGSVSTATGQGLEMNVITALVLGGVPLSGGSRVKMIGALIGSFSVIILRNGLIVLGVNERLIQGIQGIVLLLLVLLTYIKNKEEVYE